MLYDSSPYNCTIYIDTCCTPFCFSELERSECVFHAALKEYEMSEDDRRRLHDYISKGRGDRGGGGVCGLVMMAVGGALVLLSLVIGLVACLIGRRSQPVRSIHSQFSSVTTSAVWVFDR